MNPRMPCEFVDGSKTMVEMSAIANAAWCRTSTGCTAPPPARRSWPPRWFQKKDGGVLSGSARVDYSVGQGPLIIFAIARPTPRIHERMTDLKMGDGPYFSFIRPYHLTSLEVPLTCARAVLYGKADMAPLARPTARSPPWLNAIWRLAINWTRLVNTPTARTPWRLAALVDLALGHLDCCSAPP